MPELPEVETIKRSLEKEIVGRTIKKIEINKPKQFKGEVKDVVGKKIINVKRIGKMLLIDLEGELSLLVHLKMSGQLVWGGKGKKVGRQEGERFVFGNTIPFAGGNSLPGKATHIIIKTDKGTLFFNDLRQFGWIRVIRDISPSTSLRVKEIMDLGPEPFEEEFTKDYLKQIFKKTSKPIKLVLLDQEKIAGIGNIYANDALFEAGILPTRPAKSLKKEEIEKLKNSIMEVLEDGIKHGGSSAGDEAYIKPDGGKGEYQNHARVYQKDGFACPRCGGIIQRMKIAGRGTFYCAKCQS